MNVVTCEYFQVITRTMISCEHWCSLECTHFFVLKFLRVSSLIQPAQVVGQAIQMFRTTHLNIWATPSPKLVKFFRSYASSIPIELLVRVWSVACWLCNIVGAFLFVQKFKNFKNFKKLQTECKKKRIVSESSEFLRSRSVYHFFKQL